MCDSLTILGGMSWSTSAEERRGGRKDRDSVRERGRGAAGERFALYHLPVPNMG
jgi:hypothetical protein